ncbi:N-acetyltransferase [Fulvivirga sp. 29W222]|uniref:N-acetyltransferase n=2 Tax=Fulvivirga marina TaxID=2494733 RepID=A0A937G0W5_9BACT|nr:N-acetyltransferase [Fulvivirga marina]
MRTQLIIRRAHPDEYQEIGQLMVQVYSNLDGFPKPDERPRYYKLLANVGDLTAKPQAELLAAVSTEGIILGAVVYFGDMQYYGSGGTATKEKNAGGFRLLAVNPEARGQGVGKLLINACIDKARETKREQVVIHTTKAMQTAWKMYEKLGFERSDDLDFEQEGLEVFGFRLELS